MRNSNRVFCLGDGYAHGHIWPEWPQILQSLCPNLEVTVISAVGAGQEFLVSELLTHDIKDSTVIFQWPHHSRFDKLVEDQTWADMANSDPVYYFNTYQTSQGTWWCSSASKLDTIKNYHNFYVQSKQSLLRQQNLKKLVAAYMVSNNANYIATSNQEQDSFARKYECRGKEIQPSPLLHYYWLVESIMPAAGICINQSMAQELLTRISAHNWVPYDPDRKEIWQNMSNLNF